jgi:tRNA(His) 5'-end guanylyltransferase
MSDDGTSLGDRMKLYEAETRIVIQPHAYTILRLDGRAFHTYLRNAEKPFDHVFIEDMAWLTQRLCKEVSGTTLAYTQSDEISMLIQNLREETESWFGGKLQKLVSVTAATAASLLTARRWDIDRVLAGDFKPIAFDCRVFSLPTLDEVNNYFMWRQRDAIRNSIQMAAQAQFSHKALQNLNSQQLIEKLRSEAGIEWDAYPLEARQGVLTTKVYGEKPVSYHDRRLGKDVETTAMRSWWTYEAAPLFTPDYGSYILRNVPVSLGEMRQ